MSRRDNLEISQQTSSVDHSGLDPRGLLCRPQDDGKRYDAQLYRSETWVMNVLNDGFKFLNAILNKWPLFLISF